MNQNSGTVYFIIRIYINMSQYVKEWWTWNLFEQCTTFIQGASSAGFSPNPHNELFLKK